MGVGWEEVKIDISLVVFEKRENGYMKKFFFVVMEFIDRYGSFCLCYF